MPLHPESPAGILIPGVEEWATERLQRLTSQGAALELHDLLTGQISVKREVFEAVGGFDQDFTQGGSFGNEDLDFGCRLLERGYSIVFNPNAVSWQRYVVSPEAFLRQWRDAGRADVILARKHPRRLKELLAANSAHTAAKRHLWRPLGASAAFRAMVFPPLRRVAVELARRGWTRKSVHQLFFAARAIEYWSGVHEAGGFPDPAAPRVLAYHSIGTLPKRSPLAEYAIPPAVFEKQLDTLLHAGFRFVHADAILSFLLHHEPLPPRPLLLTFDDCYADLLESVLPILRSRGIPAVAFAVSGAVGGVNEWDRAIGAPELRLLDGEELRTLAAAGIEIGAHSRTHPYLPRLLGAELCSEIVGSIDELEALGLPRPRLFAYPYGEVSSPVSQAVASAGLQAAFTVRSGSLKPGLDPMLLPRIEILASDVGRRFAKKVAGATNRAISLLPSRRRLIADIVRAWDDCTGSS